MMKRIPLFLIALAGIAYCQRPTFTLTRLTKEGPVSTDYWGDELLIKAKMADGAKAQVSPAKSALRQAAASARLYALAVDPQFAGYYTIKHSGTIEELQAMYADLSADPSIEWVGFSPIFKTFQGSQPQPPTNDPLLPGQWQLWGFPNSIGWTNQNIRSDHVYVLIADTGACFGHEDFDWSRNFWNYNAFDPLKPAADDFGHGCAVSSVVVAQSNNGKGVAGVADFAKFGFVKVLDSLGMGDTKTILDGLMAIVAETKEIKMNDPAARVILNLSFGALENIPPIADAIRAARQAGVIVVAAAGNSALNIDRIFVTPASVPGVIAVGAYNMNDEVGGRGWWASNWGPKTVLLAAPGQDIAVAVPASGTLGDPSGYSRLDGTSLAAPHVAGAIALMFAKFPGLTEEQVRIRLMNVDRGMKTWKLNLRDYEPTELFASGGRLQLGPTLVDDRTAPAKPFVRVLNAGHSSARIALTGTGDDGAIGAPFGIRCYMTKKDVLDLGTAEKLEFLPIFTPIGIEGPEILLRGDGNKPLTENSVYWGACQTVDKVGNWSVLSEQAFFQTIIGRSQPLDPTAFFTVGGPLANYITSWNGGNPLLWHAMEFPLFGPAWYAGNDSTLDYRGIGTSDSELASQAIDLRNNSGSVSLNVSQFLQMLGYGLQGTHYDAAEIRVATLDDSNGRVQEKIVAENLPNNRSLGLENFSLDLSEYAGRIIQFKFRFFTNGSSLGIGWIIGQVQLKTN